MSVAGKVAVVTAAASGIRRATAIRLRAAAVRFLAGTESAHISGAYLEVDGDAHTGRYPDLPAAISDGNPEGARR
jgi:NAD(P)-dependent dehydrogenase (short-subunit alcohol dehydrogenase family)